MSKFEVINDMSMEALSISILNLQDGQHVCQLTLVGPDDNNSRLAGADTKCIECITVSGVVTSIIDKYFVQIYSESAMCRREGTFGRAHFGFYVFQLWAETLLVAVMARSESALSSVQARAR